jgi:hypothetical protein
MALKKSLASYMGADGKIVPQKDLDMHPIEEEHIRAHWAYHESLANCPVAPTQQEEHDWLIEHGAEYVKQKRQEWQALYDAAQPAIQQADANRIAKLAAWHKHQEDCVKAGINPDTGEKLDAIN